MDSEYTTQFQVDSPEDVAFVTELVEKIDFSSNPIQLSVSIETEEPLPVNELLEINSDESGLDVLFSDTKDDTDAELDVDDAPSFKKGSSTPEILSTIASVDGTWFTLDEIRGELPEDGEVNMDNLSGILWSLADNGYLEKRKDGGLNEYKLSETGRAGLNKFNQRAQAESMSSS